MESMGKKPRRRRSFTPDVEILKRATAFFAEGTR